MPITRSCRLLALACLGGAALLAACATPRPPAGGSTGGGGRQPLAVVTTVLPITLLTRAVAGDCAEITPLVPPGADPHDLQTRPNDLAALGRAQVLVKNGLGLDSVLDRLVAAAANPSLRQIDASRGVATLATAAAGTTDHDHGPVNPHIWLDPLRASQQVQTIRDGLIAADPACAAGYRRNAAATTSRLQRLHASIAQRLAPYRGRTIVAFHDVAPYFAERYGLKGTFLVDVPEMNPSPADLQRVAAAVQRNGVRALLSEPQEGSRSFQALARDLGVAVELFDPLESASAAAAADPDTYFRVMERNAEAVAAALGQRP